MEYKQKKLDKGQVEIKITMMATEMQPFVDLAVLQISNTVKFEGFRPGKATYEVIKQKLGEQEIWQQAAENAIAKNYAQAVKQIQEQDKEFAVVESPAVKIEKLAPGNELIFVATVAVMPEVKLGDYKKIRVAKQEVKIDEAKQEKVLKDLQKMRAKEKLVLRPAQLNDKVVIDFILSINKVPQENGSQKKYPLHLGENRFIPGFEEQILGLAAGQEKEFTLKFPENYWQKSLGGKMGEFKVKVLEVFEVELPELNDDFAKNIGKFENLAALKQQVADNLLAEAKEKEEIRQEQEVLEALVKQAKFGEIPEALLHNEVHKMQHEIEDNLTQQGLDFKEYLKHLKKTEKEFELELSPQALQRVKTVLALRQLQQELKIEVSPDEIDKEVEMSKQQYAQNSELLKHIATEEYKSYVKSILANRKAVQYLKEKLVK